MTGPDAPPPVDGPTGGDSTSVLAGPDQHTPPGTADAAPAGRARELAACPGCRELEAATEPVDGVAWRVTWRRENWERHGRTQRCFPNRGEAFDFAARLRRRDGGPLDFRIEYAPRGKWRPA